MSTSTIERMDKTIASLKTQLSTLRTSRANPDMLNGIMIDYYGATTPLQQVAAISSPEPMVLMLNVFDYNAVKSIERGIQASQLGLNPHTDGNVIRIRLPELTEERRKEIVKIVKSQTEDARVSIRHIRRDEIETVKKKEKEKEITEDESKKEQLEIQKVTTDKIKTIDSIAEAKEKEILKI
jgi:ribosome recycling factor